MMHFLYILLAFGAGTLMSMQAGINSSLGRVTGSALFAASISFTGGALFLYLVLLIVRPSVPSFQQMIQLPLWMFLGGILGANIVTAIIIATPRISVLTFVLTALSGQLLVAALLDHFGFFGYQKIPVNLWRIIGIFLVLTGALLTRIR